MVNIGDLNRNAFMLKGALEERGTDFGATSGKSTGGSPAVLSDGKSRGMGAGNGSLMRYRLKISAVNTANIAELEVEE